MTGSCSGEVEATGAAGSGVTSGVDTGAEVTATGDATGAAITDVAAARGRDTLRVTVARGAGSTVAASGAGAGRMGNGCTTSLRGAKTGAGAGAGVAAAGGAAGASGCAVVAVTGGGATVSCANTGVAGSTVAAKSSAKVRGRAVDVFFITAVQRAERGFGRGLPPHSRWNDPDERRAERTQMRQKGSLRGGQPPPLFLYRCLTFPFETRRAFAQHVHTDDRGRVSKRH